MKVSSFAFAAALFAGLGCGTSAYAVSVLPPNPSDFSIVETPGQYTVFNNSNDWYIYAFAVTNPAAENPSATATTTFSTWGPDGLKLQLDLNTGTPMWAFAYKSPDADISDPNNPLLTSVNLSTYLGPHSSSDLFLFSPGKVASNWGMLLINADGITQSGVNGTSETPLPAALPMFMGGVGLIGLLARRRRKQTAA